MIHPATQSPISSDLFWAAGFLEGEGSFTWKDSEKVAALQVDWEPVQRLHAIFGGAIYAPVKPQKGRRAVVWCVTGARARGVMMTLFPFLSKRRQEQIRSALSHPWRPRNRGPQKRCLACKRRMGARDQHRKCQGCRCEGVTVGHPGESGCDT